MDYKILDIQNEELDNNIKNICINNEIITPIIKDYFQETPIEEVLKKMNECIAILYEEIKMLKKEILLLKKNETE